MAPAVIDALVADTCGRVTPEDDDPPVVFPLFKVSAGDEFPE